MTSPAPPRPSAALRPTLTAVARFPVFISYGDEVLAIKERVKRLVDEAINRQLTHGGWEVQLPVVEWRDIAAQRAPTSGKTNDIFVEQALQSSVTVVILRDRMPPGTREELLAVLDERQEIDITVFWVRRRRPLAFLRPQTEVERFLEQHSNDFKYVELHETDPEATWVALAGNVVSVLLKALRGQQELHVELRP